MQLYSKLIDGLHSETIMFIPGLTGSHTCWDEHFLFIFKL